MNVPPAGRSITSPHSGGWIDHIRTAILALQLANELSSDDQDLAAVHDVIVRLQKMPADHAKARDAAMGTTPALRHVRRVAGGSY